MYYLHQQNSMVGSGGRYWYGGGRECRGIPTWGLSKGSYPGGLGKFPKERKFLGDSLVSGWCGGFLGVSRDSRSE